MEACFLQGRLHFSGDRHAIGFISQAIAQIERIEYILFVATTVHIPEELLSKIDATSQTLGISRNRFVIQACADALARQSGTWPKGFFDRDLSGEDQALLKEATAEMEIGILMARRNRGVPLP
jgi:hypothetical protein